MYAKIQINGCIEVRTGMHIGGNDAFSAIGAVDSPILKDPVNQLPVIPGSSLKGKMRSLLARKYREGRLVSNPKEDDEKIKRLFGCSEDEGKGYRFPRLVFSDMVLSNEEELRRHMEILTEVKSENTINRLTGAAMPRQIERAVRGSKFPLDIIYEVSLDREGNTRDRSEIVEDFEIIADGFKLLTFDYLGGSGSRGYGKLDFPVIHVEVVVGEVDDGLLDEVRTILEGALARHG
jgi:CRISPR-associated protein Csm3